MCNIKKAQLVDCSITQGSQKAPSGPPQQVNFVVGQVTFPYHMSDGQTFTVMFPSQVKKESKTKHDIALGNQNLIATRTCDITT